MNILPPSLSALCGFVFAGFLFVSCGSESSTTTVHRAPHQQVTELSILFLDSLQQAHPDAILLDVRSDEEWALGHLSQAAYISFDWDHRLEPFKRTSYRPSCFRLLRSGRAQWRHHRRAPDHWTSPHRRFDWRDGSLARSRQGCCVRRTCLAPLNGLFSPYFNVEDSKRKPTSRIPGSGSRRIPWVI